MARVTAFLPGDRTILRLQPTAVECRYAAFDLGKGKILQLDTRGSAEREFPGKVSQSLQIDAAGAAELLKILRREFDLD